MCHLADAVELLRSILLLDVRQESLECNFNQLLVRQNQAIASILDIFEPLYECSHRFIISLPKTGQISEFHLAYTRIEELMELLLQIGPIQYKIG